MDTSRLLCAVALLLLGAGVSPRLASGAAPGDAPAGREAGPATRPATPAGPIPQPGPLGPDLVDAGARALLFGDRGEERDRPTLRAVQALLRADANAREELVDRYLRVLDKGGGYSRVVAGRALVFYLANPSRASLVTRERALVLIASLVEVAPKIPEPLTDDGVLAGRPAELFSRIAPRLRVSVDDTDVVIKEGIPEGWGAGRSVITVDGQVATESNAHLGEHPIDLMTVKRLREILGDRLLGQHTIKSTIVLRTPSGDELPASTEVVIRIRTRAELQGSR